MRARSFLPLSAAIAAMVIASGCAIDNPMSPPQAPASALAPSASTSNTKLSTPIRGVAMSRVKPLQGKITVSQTVGVRGGTLSIPEAGATLVIPPNAVDHDIVISMTAHAGNRVAYDFEPHGTVFRAPLTLTQDFSLVDGKKPTVKDATLGYFANPLDPTLLTELIDVTANVGRDQASASIWHFSGYIYVSGRY